MKAVNLKKLLALVLSVLMIATVIVPGTVFNALAAPSSYPAPNLTTNPTYLKDFAKPSVSIPVDFSDSYVLPSEVSGSAQSGAPIVATITEQAGPNDSVSIYGSGLKDAEVFAYGLKDGTGVIKKLVQTSNKEGFINAIIPSDFQYTMYTIWVQGADGKVSAPVRVNAPKLTWIGDTTAKAGATDIRIYGKFLTTNNADGKDAKSYVYLTNGSSYYKATVTEATPYRVTVTLPTGLANGDYKVLVHNGHGGEYGWSNALNLKISSSAGITWDESKKVTVNPGDDLKSKIANAADGSTIYIKNGTYVVKQQIAVDKKLRIMGESKDGVIIVCMFTQSGGNESLNYGDFNVNGIAKAAFNVTKTPTEFTNLTFADYVNGAEYCTNITAPSNYSIDYAHGMFIYGAETTDTGVSGSLSVNNCNFKIRRIHSDTNCVYISSETDRNTIHKAIEKIYGTQYYSRTPYGSAPMWIDTNNAEIADCYFETPKEIILRHSNGTYVHDNTFVGTWVISGNSGPAVIHDNYSQNLDISNNRIYGKDEVTDPNGYVKNYDQTFARTFVFQKTYNVTKNVYVLNNNISRVGELDYGSGEHILFEDENVTYVGNATLSNSNKTLYLKDMPSEKWSSDNKFKGYITGDDGQIKLAGYSRSVVGQVVIISKGTGAGQWRTITSASNRSVTIDRDWDVQPDANSTFVVVSPFINTVVYNNTIEGPEKYYENFNSTLGINAYGSMVGTVVDRNNFSQMQAGIAINPHYNMKSYTYNSASVSVDYNFVMFADLLVMNNTIKNTRYGIWNFPSITLANIDNSTAEAAADLQLCSVIRNNDISDSRKLTGASSTNNTVTTALKNRGGVSIVVGRDYWDKRDVLSTRYWMNNIVVENNKLSDVENNSGKGFIDIGFSQNNTVLRNNTFDGALKNTYAEVEVLRNGTHSTYKSPQAPIWYVAVDGPGDDEPTVEPIEQNPPKNLDFSDGFNYWRGETSIYSVVDGVLKVNDTYESGSWRFLKTEAFNIPNAVAGTVIKVTFDVEFEDGLPSMDGNANQAGTLASQVGHKILDVYLADPAIKEHNDRIAACTEKNGQRKEIYYKDEGTVTVGPITITDPAQEFDFWLGCGNSAKKTWGVKNIVLTVTHPDGTVETYPSETGGEDGGEQGGTTPPAGDDQEQQTPPPAYYGTEQDGFNSTVSSYPNKLKPADSIYNLDFEQGFIYWSGKNAGVSPYEGSLASDSFKLVTEGNNKYITLRDDGYVNTMRSALFKVSGVSVGDKLAVIYTAKGADATKIRVTLQQDHIRGSEYVTYDETTGLNTTSNNASPGMPNTLVNGSTLLTVYNKLTAPEGWTTYATGSTSKVNDPTTVSTSKPCLSDIFLQVVIEKASSVSVGDKLDVAIDNIIIAKVVNGVYYNVVTGKEVEGEIKLPEVDDGDQGGTTPPSGGDDSGEQGGTTPPAGDDDTEEEQTPPPAYYGTEENGFNSALSSYPNKLKPADSVYNLDFEQGFIYWSGKNAGVSPYEGSLASDSFKLVDTGTNKYITLRDEGYVNTMRSALFKVTGVNVGDKLVVIYTAKGADAKKIRVTLNQDHLRGSNKITYDETTGLNTTTTNASPGMPNGLVNNSATLSVYDKLKAPTGWTTYVTSSNTTINDPTKVSTSNPCSSDIYLQVIIDKASGVSVGDNLDVAIDNIIIAKVVNGVYYDVVTGKEVAGEIEGEASASVSSIEMSTLPKTEYLKGEALDLENGKITVKYSDGTQKTINLAQNMISGYNAQTLGSQTITVTYAGFKTTFTVNVAFNPKAELSADTLVWLIGIILADDTDNTDADFNSDGNVDLLDIVYVKKQLAQIELSKAPIEGPLYPTTTEDPYEYKLVRYELHSQCKGYYFAPKAEGKYQTVILIHGQGGSGTFKETLVTNFNNWVKAGYIEPMVVVIPEVYDYEGNGLNSNDFQYYMYASQTNRFALMLNNVVNGNLCSKIDTTKAPYVAGFSMGGMAAVQAGVEFRSKVSVVGGLSPSAGFYLGDGAWGTYNYAKDIHFADDARVYLSAGKGEQNGTFVATINRYATGIAVNAPDIVTKYEAPSAWGGHSWPLCQKELFMFLLFATQNGRLPTETLVQKVCNNPGSYTVPTIVTK